MAKVYPLLVAKPNGRDGRKARCGRLCNGSQGTRPDSYGNSRHRHYIRRFFQNAPQLNPDRLLIKGTVCGVRVEIIAEPLMREIRYLDKLVDELAKGKSMDKILRNSCPNT